MSKKGGGSMPDPNQLIRAQADANRVNTYNPYSSTVFTQEGGSQPQQGGGFLKNGLQGLTGGGSGGQWSATTEFSPELQSLFTRQMDITGDPNAYLDYQDQSFANARRLLDPYYEQQNRTFEQTMANRGQPSGGEAYDTAYANLADAQNRAYENAAFDALQFGEQARMNDYNRMAQILSQATGAQAAPIDVMGPYMAKANQQQQMSNNIWNTAGQLGAAWLLA